MVDDTKLRVLLADDEEAIVHVYSATFPFLMILMLSVILISFLPKLSLAFL